MSTNFYAPSVARLKCRPRATAVGLWVPTVRDEPDIFVPLTDVAFGPTNRLASSAPAVVPSGAGPDPPVCSGQGYRIMLDLIWLVDFVRTCCGSIFPAMRSSTLLPK